MVESSPAGGAEPERQPGPTATSRLAAAPARFLALLPALLLAFLFLRVAELAAGWPEGAAAADASRGVARALADDVLALLRYLPLLFLLSLPALVTRSRRALFWSIGLSWSVLVIVQACLVDYFITARVPLGADLFAYSLPEIGAAAFAGLHLQPLVAAGAVVAVASLWLALAWSMRSERRVVPRRVAAIVFALALAFLAFGPAELPAAASETEYARSLRLTKAASFADSCLALLIRSPVRNAAGGQAATGAPSAPPMLGFRYLDPRYPFLHAEQTPDALGAHFAIDGRTPPNLVFIVVEGLGRSFSGPEADLGSFTPFLDELAGKSLYWDNFLAAQGRTFGVLPSIFGSLPFGEQGFADLGSHMPEHATLLSVLKAQGYFLSYFGGTDSNFDNERAFLERQGVDALHDRKDFGSGYARINEWGYDDNELISFALAEEGSGASRPFLEILQTITMHDPYRFLGQERYRRLFEERLNHLGVAENQKSIYRTHRDIYTSVLYTDAALRRYFEAASKRPSYANTIFVITGDHRLPEIPLSEWIDRYHVPLIIYSPLLKAPLRIKSVSSQFDIAPSLLALLSHGYGLRTPAEVAWIGSGLDLDTSFRSIHEVPLKQTKANLVDFVAGPWFLSRDTLYVLRDGLHMEAVQDAEALARVKRRFAAFLSANDQFAQTLALLPRVPVAEWMPYAERNRRTLESAPGATSAALAVHDVRLPERARAGHLVIDATFANAAAESSGPFVPLVVLLSVDGREISESYGEALSLAAGQSVTRHLPVKTDGVPGGRYYLSVFPSDPADGKRRGDGQFHIPIVLDD